VTSGPVVVDGDRARRGVALVFVLNGLCFASLVSRLPDLRADLSLSNGGLGLLLLSIAAGSILALPSSGWLIDRWSAAAVVRAGALLVAVGLTLAAASTSLAGSVPAVALGLFVNGVGTGVWDVAMNVEGAAVEHDIGRTIMPRFHAAFSLGTVVGAAVGAAAAGLGVPIPVHLMAAALVVGLVPLSVVPAFLPAGTEDDRTEQPRHPMRAWLEPRTLTIGLMVLALALTEGVANDWLAVALVDGYDVPAWLGASGFALFVTAMTVGRVAGTVLLDRFGRVRVLWSTMALAAGGVLVVVLGEVLAVVAVGIVMWGIGASLGFPVGMSAAADDPEHAPARVSVVSTIGYTAFLAGPPVLGYLGDHVGVLQALLLVAVLLVPSALAVPSARPPTRPPAGPAARPPART
jgi:MFS family permease